MEQLHESKIKKEKLASKNRQQVLSCGNRISSCSPSLDYKYEEGQGNEIEMAFDILFEEVEKIGAACPQSLN